MTRLESVIVVVIIDVSSSNMDSVIHNSIWNSMSKQYMLNFISLSKLHKFKANWFVKIVFFVMLVRACSSYVLAN